MVRDIVALFKKQVLKKIKSKKVRFIIFGSRARGDCDEFSDYDFLIITSEKEHNIEEYIEGIECDLFLKYNALINSHLFSEQELKKLSFEPFIINALKEGVAA